MRLKSLLLILSLFTSFCFFSHEKKELRIKKVLFDKASKNLNFQIENLVLMDFYNVEIKLYVNGVNVKNKIVFYINSTQKITNFSFSIAEKINYNSDYIQLFLSNRNKPKLLYDYWDNLNYEKQVDETGGESYVDAAWRMQKMDSSGNLNPISMHFYFHDSDKVLSGLKVDDVTIKIRNASGSNSWQEIYFNNDPSFFNYFSNISTYNSDRSIQKINISSNLESSSNSSINFKGSESSFENWLGMTYFDIEEEHCYFTFTIPADYLVGFEDVIDVHVLYDYWNSTDDVVCLRIFRSDNDVPSLQNWYRGDTHLHSFYTQNKAELGFPLSQTKDAAKLIGLDWITTTDHTSDFDNYGDDGSNPPTGQALLNSNWQDLQNEVSILNNSDTSMIYIPGQEVATANSKSQLVHFLAYPNPQSPYALPFLGDGYGDEVLNPTATGTNTSITIDSALSLLTLNNGFAYAAHPFANKDELPPGFPVQGGVWNLSSDCLPSNGLEYPLTISNDAQNNLIICNDLNANSDLISQTQSSLIKNGLKGAQIWNIRNTLYSEGAVGGSDDEDDPWDAQEDGGAFAPVDFLSPFHHIIRFRQGQEVVNAINCLGLQEKNNNNNLLNWKMFYSAGTDAHGSFNYSNTDDFLMGFTSPTSTAFEIHDNAVGKLSVLTYCPDGMGPNGENILNALKNGNMTISDGPIVTIGISNDGNNNISNVLMGEDVILDVSAPEMNYLNVNYTTTTEFGQLDTFKLIIGTESGEFIKEMYFNNSTGTNTLNYKLSDLFDSLNISNGVLQNKFMYIRAEISTSVNYNNLTVYKKNLDRFHSFSNPIWFKYQDLSAEVEDNSADKIKIYPNPVEKTLTVELDSALGADVFVFDLNGGLVIKTRLNNCKTKLDVTLLENSIYYLKIVSKNNIFHSKFTKL